MNQQTKPMTAWDYCVELKRCGATNNEVKTIIEALKRLDTETTPVPQPAEMLRKWRARKNTMNTGVNWGDYEI